MTRYRDIPRIKFTPKKGTTRRKRRLYQKLADHLSFEYGPRVLEVSSQAVLDEMMYGQSRVHVRWDDETQKIEMENDSPK